MNCIDAIEGTVKCILKRLHVLAVEDRLDDSEYIRSVKAVIEATDLFVQGNREILGQRSMLKQVLYAYSKDLWLKDQRTEPLDRGTAHGLAAFEINDGYPNYYYDYIYRHGLYPR
jgi:hypothetical protein